MQATPSTHSPHAKYETADGILAIPRLFHQAMPANTGGFEYIKMLEIYFLPSVFSPGNSPGNTERGPANIPSAVSLLAWLLQTEIVDLNLS